SASEVKAAKEALIRLKPNILTFVEQSNQFVQYFVNGSAWIIANAHTGLDYRVKQAGGPLVKPVYPKEGYVGFLDGEMVVKNAAHRDAAMAWLDHKNQAKYVVLNFQKQLRALANEKAMKILQQDPKYADLVHATGYDQPDVALRMILKGPPPGEGLKMYIDASLLGGYPFAYFIANASRRWQSVLLTLVIMPFWTSYLLRVYAWTAILGDRGLINEALRFFGVTDQPLSFLLFNVFSEIVVFVYLYIPYTVLAIYASLEKMDRSLVLAAMDLGATPVQTFLRIVLPQTLPGVYASIVFVFI